MFVCLSRACIIIGGFLMLSGCAVLSKAVFMLIDDNERKRVRNYLTPRLAQLCDSQGRSRKYTILEER